MHTSEDRHHNLNDRLIVPGTLITDGVNVAYCTVQRDTTDFEVMLNHERVLTFRKTRAVPELTLYDGVLITVTNPPGEPGIVVYKHAQRITRSFLEAEVRAITPKGNIITAGRNHYGRAGWSLYEDDAPVAEPFDSLGTLHMVGDAIHYLAPRDSRWFLWDRDTEVLGPFANGYHFDSPDLFCAEGEYGTHCIYVNSEVRAESKQKICHPKRSKGGSLAWATAWRHGAGRDGSRIIRDGVECFRSKSLICDTFGFSKERLVGLQCRQEDGRYLVDEDGKAMAGPFNDTRQNFSVNTKGQAFYMPYHGSRVSLWRDSERLGDVPDKSHLELCGDHAVTTHYDDPYVTRHVNGQEIDRYRGMVSAPHLTEFGTIVYWAVGISHTLFKVTVVP